MPVSPPSTFLSKPPFLSPPYTQSKALRATINTGTEALCRSPNPSLRLKSKNSIYADRSYIIYEQGLLITTDGSLVQQQDGEYLNQFTHHGRVSILEHSKRTGLACFVLNEQLRTTAGQFDLAKDTIYPDVKDFTYGPNTALEGQALAVKVDTWVWKSLGLKSPPGKVLPVFVHVEGSFYETYEAECLLIRASHIFRYIGASIDAFDPKVKEAFATGTRPEFNALGFGASISQLGSVG
ncbi:hypothetical protein ACJ41O_002201 [Fusarium nematophilum]